MHLNPIKCQHKSRFYGNMVIIYELEDKICCISKLQIDRDFLPVLFLRHEIQGYKAKSRKYQGVFKVKSRVKTWQV